VGGFAADQAQWRWPFAALAVWLATCSVLIGIAARRDPVPRLDKSSHFARDAAGILTHKWPRMVVGTVFVEGMLVFGALAFIPTHLHFNRGVDLSTAGLALVPYALGGVTFALFAGPIVRTLGEVNLARAGAVLLMSGCLVVAWAPGAGLAAAGCLLAGLGFYGLHNTLQTNATQMAPERRGSAMALFASLFFMGQSVGVAVAGVLVERAGTTTVLVAAGVAMLPVGLTFAALRAARDPRP